MQGRVIIAAGVACASALESVHADSDGIVRTRHNLVTGVSKAAFRSLTTPALELSADLAQQATHKGHIEMFTRPSPSGPIPTSLFTKKLKLFFIYFYAPTYFFLSIIAGDANPLFSFRHHRIVHVKIVKLFDIRYL